MSIATSYEQSEEVYEIATEHYPDLIDEYHKQSRTLVVYGGGRIVLRSADQRERIRGKGYDYLHILEGAYIDDEMYYGSIRPTISGNPRSRTFNESTIDQPAGWFYEGLMRGLDPDESEFAAWVVTCLDSPYVSAEEIAELRRVYPKRIFEREFMCVPQAAGGAVFEHIPTERYAWPSHGDGVIFGLDVAKEEDYTVITGLRPVGERYELCYWHRMNKAEYTAQMQVVAHWAAKYKASVYFDRTGVGNAVIEMLRQHYSNIVPITFNSDSKRQLIENLTVMLEQERIVIPEDAEVLIQELRSYRAKRSTAGNIQYSAPNGQHDDAVISLALAAWGTKRVRQYVFVA